MTEQILTNGNGLKAGEWIEVRDNENEEWKPRRFIGFWRKVFYVEENEFEHIAKGYAQAKPFDEE